MNKDFNQYIDNLISNIDLPSEAELASETKSAKISLRLKGIKHSEQAKKNMSEAHMGKSVPKSTTLAATAGRQTQAWNDLLQRVSKEMILSAIEKHGNHQTNICEELGVSFSPLQKLCKHYGINTPKKSNYEKTEHARTKQAKPVLCWKYDKLADGGKGEFVGEYYSTGEAARQLGFKAAQRVILVCNKKRPHTHGYIFEYKLV